MWNKSVLAFVWAMVVVCAGSASAPATVLVEYDAATSGGALPDTMGWTRYGTSMVHSGTYLTQDNTANDPGSDESGEYLSPSAGAGLMQLASGQYGIEFRVRPLSDVPFLGGGHYANLYVFWSDDTYAYNVTIDLDTDDAGPGTTGGIKYGQDSLSDAVTGIDWSTPHTVYIGYAGASPSGSFNFYVDGVLKSNVSVGSMARTGGFPFAQNAVDFGDGTTGQNLDVAAQWYFVRIHDVALPGGLSTEVPLIEFDAAGAGAGVDPTGVVPAWTKYGTAMSNNGTVLVQNNTGDDPITQSGEYLSPAIHGLMRLTSGQYGIEFRVRPLTDVPFLGSSHYANLYVFWSDDSYAYNVTIDLDTDDAGPGTTGGIKYGQNSMSDAVTGIDWSVPHTIFVGYTGVSPYGSFDFYVDGVFKSNVSAGSMGRSGGFPFAQNAVDFGDGTTGQGIDVAAEWTFLRIWARPYPIVPIPPGLLVEFDAAAAGAGTTPEDVSPAWARYGEPMTNNGTYLLQDNTADDPLLEYGEYKSPPGPGDLMTLGSGKYGIEFRVRPLTDVPNLGYSHFANCYVTWSDDQYNYNLTIDKYTDDVSGTGGLKYGKDSMSDAVTGIDWSTPHTIYVGYRGDALPAGEFDFYVDNVIQATVTAGNIARTGSYARNAVGFGDGTTGQPIPFEIDVAAEWYLVRIYGSARPPGVPYPCADPAANIDGDTDVDLADFAAFQECYTGPGHTGAFVHDFCECFDFGNDGSIDQADTVVFVGCVSGPGVTANAACDG